MDLQALYSGELQQLPATPETQALGEAARRVVSEEFGDSPKELSSEAFRGAVERARTRVASVSFHRLAQRVLCHAGAPLADLRLDHVRLRAVPPGLENIEAAAPVFFAHRDTWYGNPKCQINAWIPLHSVDPKNSFRFYLDDFARPVANDSANFKALDFQERGGFGRVKQDQVSVYPRALEATDSAVWDVTMGADEMLLFAAAHLHQTLPNRSGEVRFSIDFRFFSQLHERQDLGAPDPDNQSQGTMTDDYLPCL